LVTRDEGISSAANAVAADKVDKEESINTMNTESSKLVKDEPLPRGRRASRGNVGNYDFVPMEDSILPPLMEFYGLSESFTRGQFMTRKSGDSKTLYFITSSVKKNLIDCGAQDRVKVINSGLRAFVRGNMHCAIPYRPCQECIHFIAPYMTKRKIIVNLADFTNCLGTGFINNEVFSENVGKQIKGYSPGAFAVALEGYETNVGKKMFLTMWRCRGESGNVNCLVCQVEQDGMQSKLRAFSAPSEAISGTNNK